MVTLRLHNTRTRKKEEFVPLDPGNIRMYVCGPTVYDRAHLGNARPVVVFDVLYRLLRHLYGADHVTYVRNFTDVDDKINARARVLQEAGDGRALNDIIREVTDQTIGWYHADMDALGALRPTHEPRATEFIVQMVAMIQGLVASGHAYAAEGHVLFDVRSYPDYGKLSGRSVDDMIAGARVDPAPYKRDPMDFVLWKPSSAEEPGWDSPWGRGRPGWHIECSAMSHELLGPAFDIHGGGIDLQFPHHENEIAQSCCAHPDAGFATFWLHNEMVQVEGKKMSKSLGNFFTVRDLLDQGWPGEVIRFVMLSTHYRKPMDWTEEKAREVQGTLQKWRSLCRDVTPASEPLKHVVETLSEDLNTAGVIAELHQLAHAGDAPNLLASACLLGLLTEEAGGWEVHSHTDGADESRLAEIRNWLGAARAAAMTSKNFSEVDRLKAELLASGVEVRMSREAIELVPLPEFDSQRLWTIERRREWERAPDA
ncbi:MAG: cysteine--tRNA ligase [Rhodobacteraceae bacterium]|nr:MAG: cysteine--tRNA ligase [Paracoccaceae bacterium]